NAAPFLAESIESVLQQTFANFELIAINDGSADGSGEILNQYAQRDPRMRIFHQSSKGLIDTLNFGLALACGRYIARQDADDCWLPERFQRQVDFLDAHPAVGAMGSAILVVDSNGRPLRLLDYPLTDSGARQRLEHGCPFAHPAVMMRTDALHGVGGY